MPDAALAIGGAESGGYTTAAFPLGSIAEQCGDPIRPLSDSRELVTQRVAHDVDD
jgi:hypothetical protein